jgi:hypothetical protein
METKRKNKSFLSDSIRQSIPMFAPVAAKMILGLVPKGSKLDDILRDYQQYWTKIIPGISVVLMQAFNAPDILDDILTELSSETVEAIKERYNNDQSSPASKRTKDGVTLGSASLCLKKAKFMAINKLLSNLPEKQRREIVDLDLGPQTEAVAKVSMLSLLDEVNFKLWADVYCPEKKPRKETSFEKEVKSRFKDFKSDVSALPANAGFFARWANRKGLM